MYQLMPNNKIKLVGVVNKTFTKSGNPRLWEEFQKWLDDGNTPLPVQPSEFHVWNGNKWILDKKKEKKKELDYAELTMSKTVEDIIVAIIELGGSLSGETLAKYNMKKAAKDAHDKA